MLGTEVLAIFKTVSNLCQGLQYLKIENPVGPPVKNQPPLQRGFTSVVSRELSSLGGEGSVKQIKRGLGSHKFETSAQVGECHVIFFPAKHPSIRQIENV